MKDTILAYTAGLVDGEGYIGLYKNYSAKDSFSPVVKVVSTDLVMVPFMQQHFGGYVDTRKPPRPGSKQSYCWQIRNNRQVKPFLESILPYLRVKKARAEVVLSYIDTCKYRRVGYDNGTYTTDPAVIKRRWEHYRKIRSLNQRGLAPAETE